MNGKNFKVTKSKISFRQTNTNTFHLKNVIFPKFSFNITCIAFITLCLVFAWKQYTLFNNNGFYCVLKRVYRACTRKIYSCCINTIFRFSTQKRITQFCSAHANSMAFGTYSIRFSHAYINFILSISCFLFSYSY